MRIAMTSDHAVRALKEIEALLRADGHEISDFGTDDAADLPDHVYRQPSPSRGATSCEATCPGFSASEGAPFIL